VFKPFKNIESQLVYDFILSSKKPMLMKQYLISWLKNTFGLNCNEVWISPISPPNNLEEQIGSVETKLMALLCLFYDLKPLELAKMQLCSLIYVKPHFCFKSSSEEKVTLIVHFIAPADSSHDLHILCEPENCKSKQVWEEELP